MRRGGGGGGGGGARGAAGGGGPILAGVYFDAFGSYQGVFVVFVATYLAGALAILVSREPPPKQVPVAAEGAA